jgi:hypothetical protein
MNDQPIAEPDRENYVVLRKILRRLEGMVVGRLAQNVINISNKAIMLRGKRN